MKRVCLLFCLLFSNLFFVPLKVGAESNHSDLIIINKAENKLAFFEKGELLKILNIASGRKRSYTPEGSFKVINKVKNRPYYKEKIPGGSPNNPLGDRWMGLSVPGTWGHTYGIHGTNNEKSIGKYASAGCIRMLNEEVRWLYDQVSLGTRVKITHSDLSFDELAIKTGYEIKDKEVKTINKTITIRAKAIIYNEQSKYSPSNLYIFPQEVLAFEKSGHYYHITAWFGTAWIHEEVITETEGSELERSNNIATTLESPLQSNPHFLIKNGLMYIDN